MLQKFAVPGVTDGILNQSKKDYLMYVGMKPHVSRLESDKNEKERERVMLLAKRKIQKKIKSFVVWKMDCFWWYPLGYMERLSDH